MSEVYNLKDQPPGPRLVSSRPRTDIGALIASRICHDLISPLGAIANGMELLTLTGLGGSPEAELIAESVENANARIKFFRVAYGMASPDQAIARTEVTGTLRAATRGGRVSYEWTPSGDQPRQEVKAVFLLLQCFERAMAHGGHVVISQEEGAWVVTGEGPRLRIEEDLWAGLQSLRARPTDVAALVQFALLPETLAELGRSLALKLGTERIVARF